MISQANTHIAGLGFIIQDLGFRVSYFGVQCLGFHNQMTPAVSMHVSCVQVILILNLFSSKIESRKPSTYKKMQVSMKMAEGGDDYDALLTKMDKLQSAIDAIEGWELDRQLERAMQALRCPPGKLNNNSTVCAFQLMMSWYKQDMSCLSAAICSEHPCKFHKGAMSI